MERAFEMRIVEWSPEISLEICLTEPLSTYSKLDKVEARTSFCKALTRLHSSYKSVLPKMNKVEARNFIHRVC